MCDVLRHLSRLLALSRAVVCLLLVATQASAQIVRLEVDGKDSRGQGFTGKATAVCIGETDQGGSVFLTARHNFRDGRAARVQIAGRWERVVTVNESRAADVASFEVRAKCRAKRLASAVSFREAVLIHGFGPEYTGSGRAEPFVGTIYGGAIYGAGGLHSVIGDSGGPVEQGGAVVGIAVGYRPTMSRSDHAGRNFPTVYVGLEDITQCLAQVYRPCPPGGCPIYVRPRVEQPMVGIGIPVGPPRVIGEAVPYRGPVQQECPPQQPAFIVGPAGPRGPAGLQGERGPAGTSVSREQVEAIVNAWLDANRDVLRGEPGPAGPAGSTAGVDDLARRVQTLENRKIRIVTTDGSGVVDDETYTGTDTDPIVLNIRRIRSGSDGR